MNIIGVKFEVKRVWIDCLLDNKSKWKDRAAKGSYPDKFYCVPSRNERKVNLHGHCSQYYFIHRHPDNV